MSKWLTMRELIKAEERLMFARHSSPGLVRKESAESLTRQAESDHLPARLRLLLSRKELY